MERDWLLLLFIWAICFDDMTIEVNDDGNKRSGCGEKDEV
jgi:hypothetical protein